MSGEPARQPLGVALVRALALALDTLGAELAGTAGGPVGRLVLAPGAAVPADGCCSDTCDTEGGPCGQAHVRLSRIWNSTRFPAPDVTLNGCSGMLAAEIELGVYRCAAGMDGDGEPPTPEDVGQDAVVAMDDLAAMRATALSVFGRSVPVIPGFWVPVGPSGYCHGGTLLFTAQFNPANPPGS